MSRAQTQRLKLLLRSFPAVLVVGPRQCAKSTLAHHALPEWTHLDLERPADLALLAADLEGFFDAHPRSVVLVGLPARRLRTLWTMLTHGHGNLLNISDLARSLTVSSHTVSSDLACWKAHS